MTSARPVVGAQLLMVRSAFGDHACACTIMRGRCAEGVPAVGMCFEVESTVSIGVWRDVYISFGLVRRFFCYRFTRA